MLFKRDPGPCPVDDSPHTTCCAPASGGAIVAGPITPATAVIVPSPPHATPTQTGGTKVEPPVSPSPDPSFTSKTYRGRGTRGPGA